MGDLEGRIVRLIAEEEETERNDPGWTITVHLPLAAGDELHERMFMAISDVAYEHQPEERDWDLFVMSVGGNHGSVPVHLLRRALMDAGDAPNGAGLD